LVVKQERNILLLCSGWKNRFNLEDSLYAGAVTHEIVKRTQDVKLGDGCLALQYLYEMAKEDPMKFLSHASHKERMVKLNLKKDIRYCLVPNTAPVIPILEGKYLVKLNH
jgi:2-phosphosulfolactate phosphatase